MALLNSLWVLKNQSAPALNIEKEEKKLMPQTTNLTNITITQKKDTNNNDYYIIYDENANQAYFCFNKAVKSGWNDLVNDWKTIKEVELEFEETEKGKKVLSLFVVRKEDDIFIQ